ncbi:hypothetical protein [Paraburkholderia sp.]|jgi:hypothetical protein|uniref:hypothetical protein n=1 Tax=Paraburkholderia sp. TaxID=1926495 RepID=UPI002F3EB8D6
MTTNKEKHPHSEKSEKQIDKQVEDSFPASDPPSTGGTTKIVTDNGNDKDDASGGHQRGHDKPAQR